MIQIQEVVRAGLKSGAAGFCVRHADHLAMQPPMKIPENKYNFEKYIVKLILKPPQHKVILTCCLELTLQQQKIH